MAPDDVLDEALARLGGFGPEFGGGLSNHGPMVVEALVRLGRPDAVAGWVDALRRPSRGSRRADRPSARARRHGDGRGLGAAVRRRARRAPWDEVVRTWVPRLAPGLMAAATHGWLRTAHAVRAPACRETPERLAELARGLAYWAARYQDVPGPTMPSGTLAVASGIAALPDRRTGGDGLIFEAVRRSRRRRRVRRRRRRRRRFDARRRRPARRGRRGDRRRRRRRPDRLRPHVDADGGDPPVADCSTPVASISCSAVPGGRSPPWCRRTACRGRRGRGG